MTQLKASKPSPPPAGAIPAEAIPAEISLQTPPPVRARRAVLAAMCLALFMTNFDGTAGDVALPQIQKYFGSNMAGVQWFLNAYHLPVASLLLVSGKLGDVFGRKRIFLAGLAVFTAASLLCGLAPNLELLIAGRSLQGIGAAAMIPLSLAIVSGTYSEERARATAIGIWSAVSALALVAGPGLGGLLVDALSWRSIFFVNVPLGIATLSLTAGALKENRPEEDRAKENWAEENRALSRQSVDWPGLSLSVLAIALLAYSLTQHGEGPWLSPQRLGLLGITALSFGLFWVSQRRSDRPAIPRSLARNRRFFSICTTQALVFFMSGGLFFILSLFLQHVQGYSAAMTGLCFLPMNGAIIAASFASGWVAAKRGWRFPILSGLAIVAVAIVSLTGIDTTTEYSEILGKLVLAGFGGGLTIPTLAATAMNAVPPAQAGIASALSSISIELGGILGIALQGAVFSQRLRENLQQSLEQWPLSDELRGRVLADALPYLSELPEDLPISAQALQEAIRAAFVLGLQAVLWVAAIAMVAGMVSIALVPPKPQR